MTAQPADRMVVHAEPTKEFFIYMLTRDIELIDAIIDLTDNAIDGARRERGDGPYDGLWVRIEAARDYFRMADNCGGIPEDVARNYAFRFGRPSGMPATSHSIGQFGVGMKRALFKIGTKFEVESRADTGYFAVEVDVDEWKRKEEWQFRFKEVGALPPPDFPEELSTRISVGRLHQTVSEDFQLEIFQGNLRNALKSRQRHYIDRGLAISLDGIALDAMPLEFLQSDLLKPAYREFSIPPDPPIIIKLFAGIGNSEPSSAGWHVFCNGRLVLEADQSITTGWGEGEGKTIPSYHPQFARFRGYAFFDCDDAGRLPWNTTKTDLNSDTRAYQAVRSAMVTLMRPVIDFLNKLATERDKDDTPLGTVISSATSVPLSEVLPSHLFAVHQSVKAPSAPRTKRIAFSKPVEQIERVRELLDARSLREVGEKTFDYFYEVECED